MNNLSSNRKSFAKSSDPMQPTENTVAQSDDTVEKLPSPLRCLTGALIAGGLAIALYFLTVSIAETFTSKPIHSHNPTVVNIGVAVRTLVMGVSTLATAVCGLVALGLVALAIQVFIQQMSRKGSGE